MRLRKYDAAPVKTLLLASLLVAVGLAIAACGSEGISVGEDDPDYAGAVLFAERCSGCHTLSAAGTQGSGERELRVQGPNFDERDETFDDTLFAIRNGGFSGAIMPQNIVVGEDAEKVADFVAKFSGDDVQKPPSPGTAGGEADEPPAEEPPVDELPAEEPPAEETPDSEAQLGEMVYTSEGCGSCHMLASVGSVGAIGPDLDEVLADSDAESILESIVDPSAAITEGFTDAMPQGYGDQLSEMELDALIALLLQISSQ